jgi:alkylhydroperoxidase family enzyme
MEPRIDYQRNGRGAFEAMFGLEKYLAQSGLDPKLMTLIKLRASQINCSGRSATVELFLSSRLLDCHLQSWQRW